MTLADEDTNSMLTDNANGAFQDNVTMQVTQSDSFSFVCCRGKGGEISKRIINEARRRRRMEAERQQLENVQV